MKRKRDRSMQTAIALKLRFFREEAGLTQADASKHLGVVPTTISDYERGRCEPPLSRMVVLAKLYGVSITAFVAEEIAQPGEDTGRMRRLEERVASLEKDLEKSKSSFDQLITTLRGM